MEFQELQQRNKQILIRHLVAIEDLSKKYNFNNLNGNAAIQKVRDYFFVILQEIVNKNNYMSLLSKESIQFDYFYFIYAEDSYLSLETQSFYSDIFNQNQNAVFSTKKKHHPQKNLVIQRNNLKTLHQMLFCIKCILNALVSNTKITKREIYYSNVELFDKEQHNLDNIIQILQNQLRIPRNYLNIIASAKGLVSGNIQFQIQNQLLITDLSQNLGEVRQIQPNQEIEWIQTQAKIILIVEKETVFQKIVNEKDSELLNNCCLITGKGYGDYSTKSFIKQLSLNNPDSPLFYLGDCDPYGIDILFNYTFGSESSVYQQDNLPNIHYLGMFALDFSDLNQGQQQSSQNLTNEDLTKLDNLESRFQFSKL